MSDKIMKKKKREIKQQEEISKYIKNLQHPVVLGGHLSKY